MCRTPSLQYSMNPFCRWPTNTRWVSCNSARCDTSKSPENCPKSVQKNRNKLSSYKMPAKYIWHRCVVAAIRSSRTNYCRLEHLQLLLGSSARNDCQTYSSQRNSCRDLPRLAHRQRNYPKVERHWGSDWCDDVWWRAIETVPETNMLQQLITYMPAIAYRDYDRCAFPSIVATSHTFLFVSHRTHGKHLELPSLKPA